MTGRPAVRVRSARRTSRLGGCGHWVMVGARIVRLDDGRWHCQDCALLAVRLLMQAPPRPSEKGQP